MIVNRAFLDSGLNTLTARTALKNEGRMKIVLRAVTTNNVAVNFLSEASAPDSSGGAFLFTLKIIII